MATTVNKDNYFTNTGNVTFGLAGNTVSASAPAGGGAVLNYWQIGTGMIGETAIGNAAASTVHGTLFVSPLNPSEPFPGNMTASTIMFQGAFSASQSTASGSMIFNFGIYTLTGSTLSLFNSASTQVTYDAVSNNSTAFSGRRWLTIASSQWSAQPAFSQTNYWLGFLMFSSNATQGYQPMWQNMGAGGEGVRIPMWGTVGVSATTADNSRLITPFFGIYTASTAALPASIISSNLTLGTNDYLAVEHAIVFNNLNASF